MQHEVIALGTAFSDWSELTERYVQGMEALRRREPGASARMMEISRRMTQYQQLLGEGTSGPFVQQVQPVQPVPFQVAAPSLAPRWFQWIARIFFGLHGQGTLVLSH